MSVANFIPELWSTRLNVALKKALVYGSLVNTDWEGEIQAGGDIVRINQVGDVTIGNYTPNVTQIVPERLKTFQTQLLIDQIKYFAFGVDNVDKAQMNTEIMDEAMANAAHGMADAVDTSLAGLYVDAGSISAPTAISSDNALAGLLTLGQVLSENNVPRAQRWAVIPPWYTTKLTLAKVLVTDSGAASDAFNNGFVGRAAGFDLYESNNVFESGGTYRIMAGTRKAISYASQLRKIVAYEPQNDFSDAVKGLHLYGFKVVYPEALAVLTATIGAEL